MSLIQEALKRQQMEQEGKLPPPPGGDAKDAAPLKSTVVDGETFILPGVMSESAAPEAPAKPALKRRRASTAPHVQEPPPPEEPSDPEPEPDSEPEPDRKRISPTSAGDDWSEKERSRVLPSLAAVIILLLLLAGALVWAITYGLELAGFRMPGSTSEPVLAEQPSADQPAADAASVDEAAEGQVAETPSATPVDGKTGTDADKPATKTTIGSVVRQTVKDANAFVDEANVVIADGAGETAVGSELPAAATPAREPPPPITDATAEPPETAVAATPQTPGPPAIKWPDITISGVVGNEQKGAVFVNGKVIGVNETVAGIRIVAIKSQGALLEYQGETRLAKVGQPLNRATR